MWLSGVAVGCWTCDQQVQDLSPSRQNFGCILGQAVYTRSSLIGQFYFGTTTSWEGNCRSGVALATHHRQQWYYHLWAHGHGKGEEHPAYTPAGVGPLYLYLLPQIG